MQTPLRFLVRKLSKELGGKLRFPSSPVREIFCGSDCSGRSHFFVERIPPCGAGSFLTAQKGTKESLGVAFDERYAEGSAHRRLTPKPPITGDALLDDGHLHPAAPNTRPCVLFASGTQAPAGAKSGGKVR